MEGERGARPREEEEEEEGFGEDMGASKRQRVEGDGEAEQEGGEEYQEEEGYDEAAYEEGAAAGEAGMDGGEDDSEKGAAAVATEDGGGAETTAADESHEQDAAGDEDEDVELSNNEESWSDERDQAEGGEEDGAQASGMAALMGGDIDEEEDEDEDGDWDGTGGAGAYNWGQPAGPTWICRNCTADDNAEDDVICEDGCQEPRAHSLCEDPATRIAQVEIPAAQKEKEARRFHLRMAIGYDERMCLHRAVKPASQADSTTPKEDADPDGEGGEDGEDGEPRKEETAAPSTADTDLGGAEQTEDVTVDGDSNPEAGGEEAVDQTGVENPEAAEGNEGPEAAEGAEENAAAGEADESGETATAGEEDANIAKGTEEGGATDGVERDENALETLKSVNSAELATLPSADSATEAGGEAAAAGDETAASGDEVAAGGDEAAAAAATEAAEQSQPFEFDGFTCNHTREFITCGGTIKKSDDEYHTITHPERPDRLKCVYEHLKCAGLLENTTAISGREATGFELSVAHGAEHVSTIGDIEGQRGTIDGDTYYVEESSVAARLAVGVTCDVISSVVKGESDNGIALVRPPGHHAEGDKAMGFCLFNNVACGVRVAQQELGVERVLIVDWDVHHGNGTEEIFYDDPSVLMLSIHRNDMGFFPDTGHAHRTGTGEGKGYNVNVAWPKGGMGDADYMLAFHRVVLPIAYDFKPDLVVVSAGFDSGLGDPLGGCRITPEGYAHMTSMLTSLAEGKVVIVMEGGYNLRTISRSFAACARVLKGGAPPPLRESTCRPSSAAMYAVCQAQATHAEFWPALRTLGHSADGGSGRLPITGLPGPMGSMGSIPGMSESSDDEDFDASGDNSGAGDAGPGLAGMLGGGDLDDSMEQEAADGAVDDDGDVELDDDMSRGEGEDEATEDVEDEATLDAAESQEGGAEDSYQQWDMGDGGEYADEADASLQLDGEGEDEGEYYGEADAGETEYSEQPAGGEGGEGEEIDLAGDSDGLAE